MKTNHLPKNGVINILGVKAEIFFQVVNCDHIAKNFRDDAEKEGTKEQYHDVTV
ncbi:MAG: hypothetical protein MUD08_04455 [Cytophagales bacterium]|jgi:hypothetical protein|nr:hypothetical protein [Cytophagales bacterium]